MQALRLVFLTGLSGAGKSTAANALEDAHYWCVDNLPAPLLGTLLRLAEASGGALERLAFVCDVRDPALVATFPEVFNAARGAGHLVDLVFLEADETALVERFERTRRRHPLAQRPVEGSAPRAGTAAARAEVAEALAAERTMLAALRARATEVIDTTDLTVHELRRHLLRRFAVGDEQRLEVGLAGYSLRHGPPPEIDLAIDARFWPEGEGGAGRGDDARAQRCLARLVELFAYLFPLYQREGKAYLTVGLGSEDGGRRSAGLARALQARLAPLGIDSRLRPQQEDVNGIRRSHRR